MTTVIKENRLRNSFKIILISLTHSRIFGWEIKFSIFALAKSIVKKESIPSPTFRLFCENPSNMISARINVSAEAAFENFELIELSYGPFLKLK